MRQLLKALKRHIINVLQRKYTVPLTASLIISLTSVLMPIASYATVTQTGTDTVQMSGSDLKALTDGYVRYRAEAEATREALTSERKAHMEYADNVGTLIQTQSDERKAFTDYIKKLERKLNAPSLEFYGGYNTERQWEGGLRLVFRLR